MTEFKNSIFITSNSVKTSKNVFYVVCHESLRNELCLGAGDKI